MMAAAQSPGGIGRRELFVDAKDLQSRQEDGSVMADGEYAAVLATRGAEKLAEARLVQSFNAVVRTHNPAYAYGVDFFLGDTITVTDERLGVTVDAVVYGVERASGREGESLSLILGCSRPTLYERLRRKAEK